MTDDQKQLAEQHRGLALRLARDVAARLASSTLAKVGGIDELRSAAQLALVVAARRYIRQPGVRFSTYAYKCISWTLYRLVNQQIRRGHLAIGEHDEPAPAVDLDQFEQHQAVASAIGSLTEAEREIVRLRFFEGHTLEEIGQHRGTTKEAVRQFEGRILTKLGKRLKAFGEPN